MNSRRLMLAPRLFAPASGSKPLNRHWNQAQLSAKISQKWCPTGLVRGLRTVAHWSVGNTSEI
jgi:hypothetical protein